MTKPTNLTYLVPNDIPREPERPILRTDVSSAERAAWLEAISLIREPITIPENAKVEYLTAHQEATAPAVQKLVDEHAAKVAPDLPSPRFEYEKDGRIVTSAEILASLSPEMRAAVEAAEREAMALFAGRSEWPPQFGIDAPEEECADAVTVYHDERAAT
jgi:hypothetical protein